MMFGTMYNNVNSEDNGSTEPLGARKRNVEPMGCCLVILWSLSLQDQQLLILGNFLDLFRTIFLLSIS